MDDLITNFISVTGAGVNEARQMLEICDNNLESAINMFLEGGLAEDIGGPSQLANGATQSSSSGKRKHPEEEEVRAPIAPVRGRLVDDPYAYTLTANDIPKNVFEKKPEALRDFRAEANLTKADLEKQNTLAMLFRPPLEIMFAGTFDQAKEHGRETRKWMLANIQKADEFACHTLNRDLWKNEQILRLINEHFVFWQVNSDAPEGKKYARFYPVLEFPYISVIDSRTGELMLKWEGAVDQKEFLHALREFIDENDLRKPQAPPAKKQKAVHDMDEDEQIRQAIALSMAEAQGTANGSQRKPIALDSDSDDNNELSGDDTEVAGSASQAKEPAPEPITDKGKAREPEPEPTNDTPASEVTRLQVRLEDGSRAVRRFMRKQDVQCLFDYVAYLIGRDAGFEIMMHKDKLSERLGQSFEEAGVINAAVSVVSLS